MSKKYIVESDLWWFGFDCAHYGDGKDLDLAYELFPEFRQSISAIKQCESMFPTYEPVRDLEYVKDIVIAFFNEVLKRGTLKKN